MKRKRNSRGKATILVVIAAVIVTAFAGVTAENVLTSPEEQYTESWTKVRDYFLWEDRLDDWDNLKTPPANMKTLSDSDKEIKKMLATLGDKYTYYYTKQAYTKRKQRQAKTGVVSHKMLPNNVGYVKINTFSSENTAQELEDALKKLANADAYIVDLRGNGGGLVWQAFKCFALFNDSGEFSSYKGRWAGKVNTGKYVLTAKHLEDYEDGKLDGSYSRPANLCGDKPVVILMNGGSASASEMFAGAMRHHRGAELVGVTSFGKGIMQHTFALDGGRAIKVTTAQLYQPDGNSIHGTGMSPTHKVVKAKGSDNQLSKAAEVALDKVKNGL